MRFAPNRQMDVMMKRLALAMLFCSAAPVAFAEQPLLVKAVKAEAAPFVAQFELTGTVQAVQTVDANFRVGGKLISVLVAVGDHVDAGQVLAESDPTQAEAAQNYAQAQLIAAQAMLNQAMQTKDRTSGLAKQGATTSAELESAEANLLSAQSQKDQALARLSKAQKTLTDATLTAPTAGIVVMRNAEPGQVFGAGQPVFAIAKDGPREAVFFAPDVPGLEGFLRATVPLRTLEGETRTFEASVSEVSPVAEPGAGTVRIKAKIAEDSAPALGAAVAGTMRVPGQNAVSLPWTALVSDGGQPAVWVVNPADGNITLTDVTIEHFAVDQIAVSPAPVEGRMIVTAGSQLLFPGRRVTLAGEQP